MRNIICSLFVLGVILGACSSDRSGGLRDHGGGYGSGVLGLLDTKYPVEEDIVCQEEYDIEEPASLDGNYVLQEESPSSKKDDIAVYAEKSTSIEKKIIKDGDISIKTNDIAVAKQRIDNLVKNLNAYYEQENLRNRYNEISYDLTIRVPAENFEKLLSSIEQSKDEIKSKNIRTRDVTEEFVDLSTRLSSKKDYLKQYTVLLSKATKIKEILEIQEKIRNLQEEIESTEGRLRYLNDQVTFSTLSINLYKEIEYVYKPAQKDRFTERAKSGLGTGWDIIVGIVVFLINIWSVLLLLILGFFFVRWRVRKRKGKRNG